MPLFYRPPIFQPSPPAQTLVNFILLGLIFIVLFFTAITYAELNDLRTVVHDMQLRGAAAAR